MRSETDFAIDEHADFIADLIVEKWDFLVDEIQHRLSTDRDFDCVEGTIRYYMERLEIPTLTKRRKLYREWEEEIKREEASEVE